MTPLPWTDLHEHALQNIDAFREAIDHLRAGRSLTGAQVRDSECDEWTQTKIKKLRRFCQDQKLKWEWSGFFSITITDRLTGYQATPLGYRELGLALEMLIYERLVAVALRMPVSDHDQKIAAAKAAADPAPQDPLLCPDLAPLEAGWTGWDDEPRQLIDAHPPCQCFASA